MRVSVQNTGETAVDLRLDMIAFVAVRGSERKTAPAALNDGTLVLSLGTIGDLQPILALDHPTPFTPTAKKNIGANLTLEPGADGALRFACASLPMIQASGDAALIAASIDWDALHAEIERAAADIPDIETGDIDVDATIAFSYQTAIQASDPPLKPENAPDVYLLATALALVDPDRAMRLVRAAIDAQANVKPDKLWMPILARLTYAVYDDTRDQAFLRELAPKLIAFFERWRSPECDTDGDGIPEWQAEGQNGFPYAPTFALSDSRGQHADIRMAESPDLAAYLLSEASSLHMIAGEIGDASAQAAAKEAADRLRERLPSMWHDGLNRPAYRDRDTHETSSSVTVLRDARASEEQFIALDLTPPARLIIEITGGTERKPTFSVIADGVDANGQPQMERIESTGFDWRYSRGVATTQRVFARVDKMHAEGLTGGYRISAKTPNWTRLDISALIPLSTTTDKTDALLTLLHDEKRFWRPYGVPMVAADDPDYVPSENAAIRPFWLTFIGESLPADPMADAPAAELVRRLMQAQITALKTERTFAASYNPETGEPIGARGSVAGIVPLDLLAHLISVYVLTPRQVRIMDSKWKTPITLRHRGVTINRSGDDVQVTFPTGAVVNATLTDGLSEVNDPTPLPSETPIVPPADPTNTLPEAEQPDSLPEAPSDADPA